MTKETGALHRLTASALRALAASLREGPLSIGLSAHAVKELAGHGGDQVFADLDGLAKDGMGARHVSVMLDAIAAAKGEAFDPGVLFELVLSGPDLPGIPTQDTAAVFQALVQEAQKEVLLVGYAVYGGEEIFRPLAERLRSTPGLKVTFCLDIARRFGDASPAEEIVRRFSEEFRKKQWPWPDLPDLYYDPRSLAVSGESHASLHAKCVVVDRRAALITSANFTEAAHYKNIELGLLARHAPIAERIAGYFLGLQATALLVRCPLND